MNLEILDITYKIIMVTSITLGTFFTISGNLKKWLLREQNSIQRSLLKNEILKQYKQFIKQKYITLEESQVINEIYTHYRNLGGNGFVESLMLAINNLPKNAESKNK